NERALQGWSLQGSGTPALRGRVAWVRVSVDPEHATCAQAALNLLCTVVLQRDDHLVPGIVECCNGSLAFRCAREAAQATCGAASETGNRCAIVGSRGAAFGSGDLYRGADVEQRQRYH